VAPGKGERKVVIAAADPMTAGAVVVVVVAVVAVAVAVDAETLSRTPEKSEPPFKASFATMEKPLLAKFGS